MQNLFSAGKRYLQTFLLTFFRALFSNDMINWSLYGDPAMRMDIAAPLLAEGGYAIKTAKTGGARFTLQSRL